ncbi:MAG: SprB repeat-containing protein, partial [Bacteroidota bacterium]
CTDVTSGISISQPASILSASASSTNNVSCFGGSNGSINLTVSGGTSPYTFNWSSGAVTQNLSNIAAGSYSVTITDAHGCTKVVSAISITQPAGALSSSVTSSSNVSCFGGANGNITLNVTGGTTPYSYNWSNGASTQNITNVVAGTYAVTITDNKGCTTSRTGISITQPVAALSSNASSTSNVSCYGGNNGSVNLNVTGGTSPYSYSWSNGSVLQELTNVPAGNYSVIITDAQGCTTSTSGVTITQPAAALSSTNSHVNVLCRNNTTGSINITVTGGTTPYTYNWSNGANTEDLTNISAGTYTVTVTDANGCTSTSAAITITQPAAVLAGSATTTGNVACNSGANGAVNLTVTGGTSPYSYTWSNGATTQDIGGLFAGNYVVTITDANGCSATSASTVSQPAGALSSSISTSQNVSCYSGSNGSINLTVSGGTTPYTYNWSNGSTTQDISGLTSGSYTVTVTDGNACINISTAIVTQPTGSLSSNASSVNAVSCFGGSDGTINLSVTGGTTPYSYTWSNGSHSQNLTGLSSGNYSVTVTDANNCTTQTTAITISQPGAALNSSTSSTNNVSCFGGTNGAINLTVTGGTLPYSYNWSTGDNTQNLTNLIAGSYSVTITDANGCTTQKSAITISQPPAALNSSASASNNVSCFGGTNGSITLSVNGGASPYSYSWNNGAISQNLSNIPSGTYSVVVTDVHGCTTATSGISISQPSVSLNSNVSSTNNVLCFGGTNGSINLNVNGGTTPYSYNWSSGATTQNLSNATSGTYTVSITDANGCTTSNSGLQITQPSVSLNSNASSTSNVSCNGGTNGGINLAVSGGTTPYSYQWNTGTTTQNLSNISAGNYTVTVSDINGCTTSVAAISVTEPPASLNSLVSGSNDVSCFGGTNGTVNLNVTGGTTPYTYNWSNGTHSQTLSNVSAGTYSVSVVDANGCTTVNTGIVISQPAGSLSASVSASQNVSCYSGANGSINLSVSGGTSPYTYNWSNGANTQDISGLSSGSYTVTITDANGCTFNRF